jgi:hypothetical protein
LSANLVTFVPEILFCCAKVTALGLVLFLLVPKSSAAHSRRLKTDGSATEREPIFLAMRLAPNAIVAANSTAPLLSDAELTANLPTSPPVWTWMNVAVLEVEAHPHHLATKPLPPAQTFQALISADADPDSFPIWTADQLLILAWVTEAFLIHPFPSRLPKRDSQKKMFVLALKADGAEPKAVPAATGS